MYIHVCVLLFSIIVPGNIFAAAGTSSKKSSYERYLRFLIPKVQDPEKVEKEKCDLLFQLGEAVCRRKDDVVEIATELMYCALFEKNENDLKDALHFKAKINDSRYGVTPLMFSAFLGLNGCAQLLCQSEASVDAANEDGTTALHISTVTGNVQMAKDLVDYGAGVNQKQLDGMASLHFAATYGKEELVNYYLSCGADCNAQEKNDGQTPLMLAILGEHKQIALNLIRHPTIDVNIFDRNRNTALHYAPYVGNEVVSALLSKGAGTACQNKNEAIPLHTAVGYGDLESIKLIMARSNINAQESTGSTPLMIAIMIHKDKSTPIVKDLLNAGADPNLPTLLGQTPLHMAAYTGLVDVVALLLEHNADPLKRCQKGFLPIKRASNKEVKRLFIDVIREKQEGSVRQFTDICENKA